MIYVRNSFFHHCTEGVNILGKPFTITNIRRRSYIFEQRKEELNCPDVFGFLEKNTLAVERMLHHSSINGMIKKDSELL